MGLEAGTVSAEELNSDIARGEAPCVVDVRSKAEFAAGHVPGAIHIPFWQMATRWRELLHLRDRPIVVYCGHGPRAFIAGAALKRRGFSHIAYLAGHMKKWNDLKLPLEGK